MRKLLAQAGLTTLRAQITIVGGALLMLGILTLGRHLSSLPRFPLRLLQTLLPNSVSLQALSQKSLRRLMDAAMPYSANASRWTLPRVGGVP